MRCPRPDKIPFETLAYARERQRFLAKTYGVQVRPYKCGCGAFHVGHRTRRVEAEVDGQDLKLRYRNQARAYRR